MKRILIALIVLATVSCQQEATTTDQEASGSNSLTNQELETLKEENMNLKHELMVKDSMYNYYAAYMNDIRNNLDLIQGKQKNIYDHQANPEMLSMNNENLIEEIQNLGKLLNDNKSKIAKLKAEIKNNNTEMNDFETMIISLSEEVEMKNMEVFQLQQELENVDAAFGELFTAFQEKSDVLVATTDELNTAYYAYGTKKELIANKVITTEGGVLGIGKNKELADDFNKDYFTEVDITQLKEIPLGVNKIEFISTHPSSSYEIVESDKIDKIIIKDAKAFWSISKYLVLVVK